MQVFDRDEAYRLMGDLLKGIRGGVMGDLAKFGVTHDIFEEIEEELQRSREDVEKLTLPPPDLAFVPDGTGRIPFDIFEMDANPSSRRVACQLWSDGERAELTLVADLSIEQGEMSLAFRLLETQ
ncbi:hypothetical protein [Burkholderia sp. D-99]|uniref:hypothetical protein n=1 Tax=Burkholderia sp. D-99 TaxID=2717316 RepID=UPI0014216F97|nr:hypothetical protein [Burkholderia sp. D-99]NHV31810.1 hypothetical protein [Burkholderia sp. D-99]